MSVMHLHRINEGHNVRRLYRLDIESELSGGVLLMKERG